MCVCVVGWGSICFDLPLLHEIKRIGTRGPKKGVHLKPLIFSRAATKKEKKKGKQPILCINRETIINNFFFLKGIYYLDIFFFF